jgi:hypothetical protein
MNTIVSPMKRLYAMTALLFMMMIPAGLNAQTAFGEDVNDEEPEEPNPVPVNGYLYAGVVAAGVVGYAATRQKKAAV